MVSPYKGKFKVTQRYKGNSHKGLDLVGVSKAIYVPQDSDLVIEFVGWDKHPTDGMGLYIRAKRVKDGLYAYFAHLSEIFVKEWQLVRAGERIGTEGSTGHSTGSHLHYEVRKKAGDNTSYVDVAALCGIPNELGTYEAEEDDTVEGKDIKINIGDKTVDGKLLPNGEAWGPVRQIVDAVTDVSVSWDNKSQEVNVEM